VNVRVGVAVSGSGVNVGVVVGIGVYVGVGVRVNVLVGVDVDVRVKVRVTVGVYVLAAICTASAKLRVHNPSRHLLATFAALSDVLYTATSSILPINVDAPPGDAGAPIITGKPAVVSTLNAKGSLCHCCTPSLYPSHFDVSQGQSGKDFTNAIWCQSLSQTYILAYAPG